MCVESGKVFALFLITSVCVWVVDGSVIVYTEEGAVSGTDYTTVGGRTVTAFLGVPYAQPPLGELRFKEPKPVEKWEGIRAACNFSSRCAQLPLHNIQPKEIIGEEDCLYLNIFTPTASNTTKLNVIFFIHGGAFMFGSGDVFRPDFILDDFDVVYVSINYRLGPFGFMTTEDGVIPGNNGLKDQVLALQWVQNNIEMFGGDKSKVTIAGLSAGGASVHLHYLSPLSRGLFQQGISVSGSALCPWVLAENARMKAHMLANSVGCATKDSLNFLECLQNTDPKLILSQMQHLFLLWGDNPFSPFAPVVEKNAGASAYLDKNPYEMLIDGNVKDAPWLTSATIDEGLYPAALFLTNDEMLKELNSNWNELSPFVLDFNHTVKPEHSNKVSQLIMNYYLGENIINSNSRKELTKMISDRLFTSGIELAARLQASVSKSSVYFYSFAYRGEYSISEIICKCKDDLGVSHADDLIYLLNAGGFSLKTDEDKAMVKTMVNIWHSFLESGVPTGYLDSVWNPVSSDADNEGNISYLLISSSSDLQPMTSSDLSNRKFWDQLPLLELWGKNEKGNRHFDEL